MGRPVASADPADTHQRAHETTKQEGRALDDVSSNMPFFRINLGLMGKFRDWLKTLDRKSRSHGTADRI